MKICDNCLCADVCALRKDKSMAEDIEKGICGKFRNIKHHIHIPCEIGDIIWDKEGNPLKVLSIEKFPNDIHLHCEIWTPTGGKKTVCVGKRSIGRTVFLTAESFAKRQNELKKKGAKNNEESNNT